MSDHASTADAIAIRVECARAVIAGSLAARTGHPIATSGAPAAPSGQLTLSPYWPLGYQLASELIALELLTQPQAQDTDTAGGGITTTDLLISETAAFLFDKLVNPVLPAQTVAPEIADLTPINAILDETLHRAQFAGDVQATTPAALAATALLFVTDEHGVQSETATYLEYLDFARRATETQNAVDSAAPNQVEQARGERDRVLAEWLIRGHRQQIEQAIRVILEENLAAGFEDERAHLIQTLEKGRRARIDAPGFSFFPARILQLQSLLEPDSASSGWSPATMDAADFTRLLTAAATPMGLPQGTVERASDGFRRLTFEFLKCDVLRDWFNEDFLRARYWRLADGELLSDGGGGGRLPGFPTSLLFIRNAEMEFEGALTARFDPAAGEHLPIRTLRVASMQPAPSHLKTDQALAVARKLHLPLAAAMLTSAPLQHAGNSNEETIVVSAAARVAAITRETHAPLRETRQITVRDHRHQQSSPGQVRPQPGTTPVHVTIESSGPPINGIVVDVASAGSATRRAVLAGDESTVTGTVHVAGAPTGKPVPLLVTVSDTNRPLDQQTIKLGNQPVELRWRIEAEPIRITLTPATTPTLFGYLVRPVPRCPDPDEQLPWR